jgi:hypothetical protein
MVKRRRAYESTDKQYDFHICHLSPLKGSETVGLTNAHNCIIGLAKLNQKMSNKEIYTEAVDGIHYIYRDSLQNKWEVGTKNESRIREMLVEYFGEGLSVWAKGVGFTPRDSSGYKHPIRMREKTFLVMLEQLFGKAAKTLDGDERNSIGLAWLSYQYQYLSGFDEELNDQYLGREEELEAAGIALQKYLMTGDSEHAGQAENELKKLVEKDYMRCF